MSATKEFTFQFYKTVIKEFIATTKYVLRQNPNVSREELIEALAEEQLCAGNLWVIEQYLDEIIRRQEAGEL